MLRFIAATIIVAAMPAVAQVPDTPIIVTSASSRAEIQRILDADNLDTANLKARDVADSMASIERGRAPEDFWTAYQAHVRAWRDFADAETESQILAQNDPDSLSYVLISLARAEQLIETTFDEVERVALNYGARIPIPPDEIRRTT